MTIDEALVEAVEAAQDADRAGQARRAEAIRQIIAVVTRDHKETTCQTPQ